MIKSLMVKVDEFDIQKARLNLKVLFLNEQYISDIKSSLGKTLKVSFSDTNYRENLRDSTRKRWFQVLGHILDQKDKSNEYTLLRFHNDTKESIFEHTLSEEGLEIIPSINSLSDELVKDATDIIIERYSQRGIDFTGIV